MIKYLCSFVLRFISITYRGDGESKKSQLIKTRQKSKIRSTYGARLKVRTVQALLKVLTIQAP
jgi:hypothetical protein